MDIVVYGGSGMVGSRIVAEALRRQHRVRVVTRSATPVDGATALRGDLADTGALRELAEEADAVVLAVPPDRTGGPAEPIVEAHRAITAAVPDARLLVVGGAGSLTVDGRYLKDGPDFPAEIYPEADAFTRVLDLYRESSGLDWTLVAPAPQIGPGARTGRYRVGGDEVIGERISAEDFAVAVLDELEEPAHRNARFAVAN